MSKKILVFSAHAVDFVWRCGGTIAKYVKNGNEVKIIDLTFGSRGESDAMWRQNPGITEPEVRAKRKEEALAAAKVLGASIEFFNWDDHLLTLDKAMVDQMAKAIKEFHPDFILTHTEDPANMDHTNAHNAVIAALRSAQVWGVHPELPVVTDTNIYFFEPDISEFAGFNPNCFIDITDVIDLKIKAMEAVGAQQHLIKNYTNRAEYRGVIAKRMKVDPNILYAEAFQSFYPRVANEFV